MNNNVQIINGFKTGDNTIIINAFKRTFPIVKKYVLANSGNINDAKEVMWLGLEKFRKNCLKPNFSLKDNDNKPIEFVAYMYGICRYTWLDILKKRNRNSAIFFTPTQNKDGHTIDINNFIEGTASKEESLAFQELKTFVVKCIGELSDKCKQIFRLNAIEQKAHKEIADEIGISVPASRKRLTDCRKHLKNRIQSSALFKEFKDEKLIRKFIGY